MGVYSANRTYSFGGIDPDTIAANENYTNAVDAELILIENHQNDMAIFEAILASDFHEAVAFNEGTILESEMTAITEGAIGDFFNKIKEFLKKVWEKIKGIFHAFMVKVNTVVIKDNKKFAEKYKKEFLGKNLSKLKYKWSEETGKIITCPEWNDDISRDAMDLPRDESTLRKLEKINDELNDGDYVEKYLKESLGNNKSTTLEDYVKDAHEYEWKDEEEVEGLGQARASEIFSILTNASKTLSTVEDMKKKVDKTYSDAISKIEKKQKELIKLVPVKDGETVVVGTKKSYDGSKDLEDRVTKTQLDVEIAKTNTAYSLAQAAQTAVVKATQARVESAKFKIKQARTVFAKAVAFNPKSVKENAVFVEAVGEAAAYEFESLIESYI